MNLFQRVKEISIEAVMREYFPSVELKRSGHDLVGHCPFHNENTASFHVYTEKNRWHCYGGCAKGGSNVDLLLMGELAFKPLDAAKALALKFGIELEKPKRKANTLTVAQYAEFCGLPESFLVERFSLSNSDAGVEILYKDSAGVVVSIQRRYCLEKPKTKDNRFRWRKGDKPIAYGLWLLPETKTRLVVVEGASDVHVLAYCDIAVLGVPGASSFKPEMTSSLLPFAELALIQELGPGGEKFIESITKALKGAEYKGVVRAVTLPEKDPRALWLKSKDKAQYTAALDQAIAAARTIELYPPVPLTRDLIDKVEALFRRHVFFREQYYPLLLATWVLGTYIYKTFSHYGYLNFSSVAMRSGKTLALDILSQVAANATARMSNPSESILFRLAQTGATLILDEIESLRNQDREKFGNIMGLLNAGFQAGAKVARSEKVEDKWVPVFYDAFCPKALAGINKLSDTLLDRSFQITMTRKLENEKVERFSIRRQGKQLAEIRECLKLWAGEREKEISQLYDAMDQINNGDELKGLDDRLLDIAEPLVAISVFSDSEHSNGGGLVTAQLCGLLRDMAKARGGIAEGGPLPGIVRVFVSFLEKNPQDEKIFVSSQDMLAEVTEEIPWIDTPHKLSGQLRKLGLHSRRDPAGKKRGFTLGRQWVEDLRQRYVPILSEDSVSESQRSI